jgi:hypothetical protein
VTTKGLTLRGAYLAGVCAALALAVSSATLLELFGFPPELRAAVWPVMGAGFAAAAAPTLFLTFRPYWWGKLFVLWPALSWIGFTLAMTAMFGWSTALVAPLACGSVMLLIAITHQFIDPRFSGAPLD